MTSGMVDVDSIIRRVLARYPHWVGPGPAETRRNKELIIKYTILLTIAEMCDDQQEDRGEAEAQTVVRQAAPSE